MADVLFTALVVFVLGAWLLLTALGHLPGRVGRAVRAHDPLNLLPHYNFFAPVPGTSDYHLLVRDQVQGGGSSAWYEVSSVTLAGGARSLFHQQATFLWNPDKRTVKAFIDATSLLLQIATRAKSRKAICISLPYLILLNLVSQLPRSPFATSRQFMLVATQASSPDPEILFVSEMHSVEEFAIPLNRRYVDRQGRRCDQDLASASL